MKLITIKTFNDSVLARILKSKLESEGIPCLLFDENMGAMEPFGSIAYPGIRLVIREEDLPVARELLTQQTTNFTA